MTTPFLSAKLFPRTFIALAALLMGAYTASGQTVSQDEAACKALFDVKNLTIIAADLRPATATTPQYCYVRGLVSGSIHFHVQLPLPRNWNGRFLGWGDGGKDGDLDFADERLAQGYAVTNSNTGHDSGAEPGSSFGFGNRQAEIDYGYRAVHVTTLAAKAIVKAYYGKDADHSYFEGCSNGGREALMEAQRYPYDYDGMVGGAPVNFFTAVNVAHVWMLQQIYAQNLAGNLAFDADGDGVPESLNKLNKLHDAVIAKCDLNDGIKDGLIQDPTTCDFRAERDMPGAICSGDANADGCFTEHQLKVVRNIYRGPFDSKGASILKGYSPGSEWNWANVIIPDAANKMHPAHADLSGDQFSYLFYDNDPGMAPPDEADVAYVPNKKPGAQREFVWWDFNVDDYTGGKGKTMMSILDSSDPDMHRYFAENKGKLILYHGWDDVYPHPEPTVDYYKDVVRTTFAGSMDTARKDFRLFMVPGMGHCGGGPGPNKWDKLSPLVDWVEKGTAPDYLVAVHEGAGGKVDNERKICAYPQKDTYTGPAGGQNDPANWVSTNFTCK